MRTVVTVIVLYFLSLCIALPPIGESILRFQTGAKKIKRKDLRDKLEPLFSKVYEKAKLKDPSLPNDVRHFIANDISENAFAVGRKTAIMGIEEYFYCVITSSEIGAAKPDKTIFEEACARANRHYIGDRLDIEKAFKVYNPINEISDTLGKGSNNKVEIFSFLDHMILTINFLFRHGENQNYI